VVLAGLAVLGAAGVVVVWPRPRSRITRRNPPDWTLYRWGSIRK
jgi:hypothetical protein